eukprot:8243321-Lingulodinium_polyedra.AAC.1
MEKARVFAVTEPWYWILEGGRIRGLFRAARHDAFVLRERFTSSCAFSAWASSADVRDVCAQFPVESHRFCVVRCGVGLSSVPAVGRPR